MDDAVARRAPMATPPRHRHTVVPDAHGVRSEPSLLQLAEETGDVWLLDVASTPAPPLAALHSVMASDAVRVLGFGFAADFERCRFPVARRVVDLRDACASASASGTARGLAAELAQHGGLRLDKTEQCSDWQRRPLSAAPSSSIKVPSLLARGRPPASGHWTANSHPDAHHGGEQANRAKPTVSLV